MVEDEFNMVIAKPFVKWAGGKTQLLDELTKSCPKFNSYHEPFVGGGALFFNLFNKNLISKAHLYDYNQDLINLYKVVKERPLELIKELKSNIYVNNRDTYYKIRASRPKDVIKSAARLIYLNRTAYNGLYRVNSKGEFNVPFGNYKKLSLPQPSLLIKDSIALQSAELHNSDFSEVLSFAHKGDLVYFDPPYQPLSKTSSFTSYTSNSFNIEDQMRLAKVFSELDKMGCYVMLSNSSAKLIKELYSNYYIEEVMATRAINCKPNGRGKIKEFIVRNWEISTEQKKLVNKAISEFD
ncbi:MAG: DNA adenine methylase [Sulfolobaceae archaeon]